jgi:hypothetical protein
LLNNPDVASVGVGWDPAAGYVVTADLITGDTGDLPHEIDGHAIRYEVTGAFAPFQLNVG